MTEQIRGFGFPFRFDERGRVVWSSGAEKIRQNVVLVLGTRLGERPMLRGFGTRLAALVHNPNDQVLADLIRDHVRDALLQWEPRILLTEAQIQQQEGELKLQLTYAVVPDARTERMVVPLA